MKITLINHSIVSVGPRLLSSILRDAGHQVDMIFLEMGEDYGTPFDDRVTESIIATCRDADLIGLSLSTNFFLRSAVLSDRLRAALGRPVIWGGIHPTVEPDECLPHADYLCLGEGDEALVELCAKLADGQDGRDVANIWSQVGSETRRTALRPLLTELDDLPFPDYEPRGHFAWIDDRLAPLTHDLQRRIFREGKEVGAPEYSLSTARGCPHSCSYCCNNAFHRMFNAQEALRTRSPRSAVAELEHAVGLMPYIGEVWIMDDTFFARSREDIVEFSELYRQRIKLPLRVMASPTTLRTDKLEPLIDAGLTRVSMGIQAYDPDILADVFNRPTSLETIDEAVKTLNGYSDRIPFIVYHLIIDNPYESLEVKKRTLRFITDLPSFASVNLHALIPFPGTEIIKRMSADGLVGDREETIYNKRITARATERQDLLTYVMIQFTKELEGAKGVQRLLTPVVSNDLVLRLLDRPEVVSALERARLSLPVRWVVNTAKRHLGRGQGCQARR